MPHGGASGKSKELKNGSKLLSQSEKFIKISSRLAFSQELFVFPEFFVIYAGNFRVERSSTVLIAAF